MLRPVTCILGAFGSGKTEVAINLALLAAGRWAAVNLVDLDTVTPAFRSRQVTELLQAAGVRVIAPAGHLAYADLPSIPPEVRGVLDDASQHVILDVGGNPAGAKSLGSVADLVRQRSHHCWVVVSPWRPDTRDSAAVTRAVEGVTRAAAIGATGLILNLHVPSEVSPGELEASIAMVGAAGETLGLPVAFGACVPELLAAAIAAGPPEMSWMQLKLHMRAPWDGGPRLSPSR
jgi:hypothetical protein